MTIDEMKKRKQELGYSNKKVSDLSGVPLGTVAKIFGGSTECPRYETILALERAFQPKSSALEMNAYKDSSMVCEASAVYGKPVKQQGSYTLEDYLNLPDDGPRKELIDGVFYDMGEPATAHQAIVGYVYKKLLDFVMEHKGPCMPLLSPVAVQLDRDDKTVVEPDVVVVCDRSQFQYGRIMGAPDFIMEVLSPSTRRKDMTLKAYKYQHAGVKEYWIADPKTQKILVYDYEHDDFPSIYGFQDRIPVLIWNRKCIIDLAEMYNFMGFLLE